MVGLPPLLWSSGSDAADRQRVPSAVPEEREPPRRSCVRALLVDSDWQAVKEDVILHVETGKWILLVLVMSLVISQSFCLLSGRKNLSMWE
ncbi:hypothetical protein Q9966_000786 [Columba livia]|nr:hypothetical protein Q9966_000786 [Columba livia]